MAGRLIKKLMRMAGYAADGKQYSLLEYLLWETEQMHGRIRRYTSPDEHAFFSRDLPPLVLPPIQYPEVRSAHCHDGLSRRKACKTKFRFHISTGESTFHFPAQRLLQS
jgi:hypothetical protein